MKNALIAVLLLIIAYGIWKFYVMPNAPVSGVDSDDRMVQNDDGSSTIATLIGEKNYVCDNNRALTVELRENDIVSVALSDNPEVAARRYTLDKTSATGGVYANENGDVMLTINGSTAVVSEKGAETFSNCQETN